MLFPMDAQAYATDIVKKLAQAGHIAYFAGGWVRDYLMGHPSDDIDIATDAPPEKILDLFPRTILVGLAFGIVIVVVDGHQFEVATFRRDINYVGGRRPEKIEMTSPQEDATRRDFTINGMFYDPLTHEIHDYVQGQHDLKLGIIRSIGDPYERFFEDRLRMVRAIRFAARFGFAIDPDTQNAIQENANTLFPSVAMERIWQEFNKMAAFPHFDAALIEMHRLGLLPVVFPSLEKTHLNTIKKAVANFNDYPQKCPTILYLMGLFPEAGQEEVLELCQYIRASGKEAKLVEYFLEGKKLVKEEAEDKIVWTYFYAHPHSELCLEVIAADLPQKEKLAFREKHQNRRKSLERHIKRVQEKRPILTASMLQAEGILGKAIGTLMKEAEKISILRDLHDPEEILIALKSSADWPK